MHVGHFLFLIIFRNYETAGRNLNNTDFLSQFANVFIVLLIYRLLREYSDSGLSMIPMIHPRTVAINTRTII